MNTIEIITIIPKNRSRCKYIINDGEPHNKSYKEIQIILTKLVPELSYEIAEKLRTYSYFILSVPERKIYDLKIDTEEEFHNLKDKIQKFNIKDIKIKSTKGVDNLRNLDKIINQISRLE